MIALSYEDREPCLAAFPEQCLKATPDPEFLSNLYGFDMSLCPNGRSERSSSITELFTEKFDAINSSSRMPELLVWMTTQVCPTIIVTVLLILIDFYCTSIETP